MSEARTVQSIGTKSRGLMVNKIEWSMVSYAAEKTRERDNLYDVVLNGDK